MLEQFLSDFKINRLILAYHCLKILPSIEVEENIYALELPIDSSVVEDRAPFELEVDIYINGSTPKRLKPIHVTYRSLGRLVGPNREPVFDKIDGIGTKISNEVWLTSNSYVYAHRYPELLEEIRDNIRILQGGRSIADVDNRLSNSIPKMWSYIEEELIHSPVDTKQFTHYLLTEDMLEGW